MDVSSKEVLKKVKRMLLLKIRHRQLRFLGHIIKEMGLGEFDTHNEFTT